MASLKMLIILVTMVMSIIDVDSMCMPEHPQTAVCRAQFVIKAKVVEADHDPKHNCSYSEILKKSSAEPKEEHSVDDYYYKPKQMVVRIIKIFKGFQGKTTDDLVAIDSGSPWGPKVKEGKTYLLTGYENNGKSWMTMCNWYSLWRDLTYVQKTSLRLYYLKFCNQCQVKFCPDGKCQMKENHCSWTPYQEEIGSTKLDCQSKFGLCVSNGKRCVFYSPKFTYACHRGPVKPYHP